jgi:hypothetical protein
MSRSRLVARSVALVVGLVALFCAVGGASSGLVASRATKAEPWTISTRVDEGPTVSGNSVVLVTSRSGGLSEVALNSGTGDVEWSLPFTLSLIPPTEEVPPAIVDGVALVLTPATSYFNGYGAGLEGVTVGDGVPAWTTKGALAVLTPPTVCPGPGGVDDFCVLVTTKSGGRPLLVVLSATSGATLAEYSGVEARLAPGLFETAKAPLSLTLFTVPGGYKWTRSISELFAGNDYSPQYGSQVGLFDGVFVMTLDHALSGNVEKLSQSLTVGVSSATGAVLWRDEGSFECGGVAVILGPYLCDETGTLTIKPGKASALSKATATIEGVDPSTGRITWRFRVGDVEAFLGGSGVAVESGLSIVVPGLTGTPTLLNLDSGKATAVPVDTPLWCPREEAFADETVASSPLLRLGSAGFQPCNAYRLGVAASPGATPPSAVFSGFHLIWVTAAGASAVPAPHA